MWGSITSWARIVAVETEGRGKSGVCTMGKATELRDRVNMEVKESDSKIMPRLQHERKDDLAYQHITFQESGQC